MIRRRILAGLVIALAAGTSLSHTPEGVIDAGVQERPPQPSDEIPIGLAIGATTACTIACTTIAALVLNRRGGS